MQNQSRLTPLICAAIPKMNNMLNDTKLFGTAGWGTHGADLKGRIDSINAMISLGLKLGCDMTTEILLSSQLYIPLRPLKP